MAVLFVMRFPLASGNIDFPIQIATIRMGGSAVVGCLTRDRGAVGFEPHQRHYVVVLSKTHLSSLSTGSTEEDPSLFTERLLMAHKESN